MAQELDALYRDTQEPSRLIKSMTVFGRGKTGPSGAPANDGAQRRVDPGPSIVSIDVEFKGTIVTPNELHIHGVVLGDVRAGTLRVCTGGHVKGDVIGDTIIVAGKIEGRVFGKHVQLTAGADVAGDIAHCTLGIDTAATFEGSIKRYDDPIKQSENR